MILITHSPIATIVLDENGSIAEIYETFDQALPSLISKTGEIICDSKSLLKLLINNELKARIDLENANLAQWRKNRFDMLMNNTGLVTSYEDYENKIRNHIMVKTREQLVTTATNRDELVAQMIHAIDDTQKSLNLFANRLSEIYSLHFPELVDLVTNPVTLAKIVSQQPQRSLIEDEFLKKNGIPKNKRDLILSSKETSLGGDISDEDAVPIVNYASQIIDIDQKLHQFENWVDKTMNEIAPNLSQVAGANVGARLIAAMGSLHDLALRSSSKIQIIGAEKALYSAIKRKGKPPKHGIIFQIPEIGNSPYWIRGKIARAFAGKIAIAARLDRFGGEFLGAGMRENLRNLVEELRVKHPTPPERKSEEKKKKRRYYK
jgi:nucleolar protein 56